MRVLDLFSGIGGFSLGLERAGMTTVAFCEIDPFCQRVLAKHWPEVPIHDDITKLDGRAYRGAVDVVCGGFPCQPFSTASSGKRYGETHDSYLWPEMLRVVRESEPAWVIGENVAGLESMALEQVVSDLEAVGYEVMALRIPACAVGFPHRRDRIWVCAYADRESESRCSVDAEMAGSAMLGQSAGGARGANGLPAGLDARRRRALGNAVVPQVVEQIGRAVMGAA